MGWTIKEKPTPLAPMSDAEIEARLTPEEQAEWHEEQAAARAQPRHEGIFRTFTNFLMQLLGGALGILYMVSAPATFLYLTFFDGVQYNAWNWIIILPANCFLASIWPIYWAILHWL